MTNGTIIMSSQNKPSRFENRSTDWRGNELGIVLRVPLEKPPFNHGRVVFENPRETSGDQATLGFYGRLGDLDELVLLEAGTTD